MKFPDFKIGEIVGGTTTSPSVLDARLVEPQSFEAEPAKPPALRFHKSALFKVVGSDKKIYGPVSGQDIEKWLADDRIKVSSLAQKAGHKEWKPLASFAQNPSDPPLPPPVSSLHMRKD
jgi:hypothetical protein